MRSTLFLLPVLCSGLAAQSFFVPDNNAGTGTCNVIPFGYNTSTWYNQIYQQIVTSADLSNNAGLITDIAFAPCGSGTRRYTRLRVTMSHVNPNHVLDPTFANNLPAPIVVLDRANGAWEQTANAWNAIGLDTFFPYDGSSDLVIEILAEGNDFSGSQGTHRDVRDRVYAFGWTGSPPLTGTGPALGALKIGIYFGTASVTLIGEGCGGLGLNVNGVPQIGGGPLTVNIVNAAPNSPTVLIIGGNNGTPFPIDLSFLGLVNCFLYHDIAVAIPGNADGSGLSVFPIGSVPNNPRLIGGRLYTQGANVNAAAPGSVTTSNYARLLIGT